MRVFRKLVTQPLTKVNPLHSSFLVNFHLSTLLLVAMLTLSCAEVDKET